MLKRDRESLRIVAEIQAEIIRLSKNIAAVRGALERAHKASQKLERRLSAFQQS